MPRYQYTAQASGGEQISSIAEVASLPALAADLEAQGCRILYAREVRERVPRIRGVPYFDIIAFYRQLAASLEAGLPMAETLCMLSSESRNVRLKSLIYFLRSQVMTGKSLSEAMSMFEDVFPEVHLAVVRAGEESGRLEEALDSLADQAETLSSMNRRFASALVYPSVIAFAALSLFSFSFMVILPRFQGLFSDLGITDYPALTRFVFFLGSTLMPVAALVLAGLTVLITLVFLQRKTSSGKMWIDSWKLRVPALGQIVEKAALARFSGILGLLLDSGVDLPRAVKMASEGAGNRTVEGFLKNVAIEVETGRGLGESLEKSAAIPSTLAWRIGVGEETGNLPEALMRTSKLYASQVDSLVTSLAGLLEPTLIILLGSGVAMLVLGMFLPLVSVIQSLTGGG